MHWSCSPAYEYIPCPTTTSSCGLMFGNSQATCAGQTTQNLTRMYACAGQDSQDTEVGGTVMVRDVVNRQLLAHFRAHTSPLLALQFDPSGTLLVTASLHGHHIHIFHICPRQPQSDKPASARPAASAVHLFQLSRGVTPAIIEDMSFSQDGAWLAVSSARGTTHLFRC